MIDFSHCQNVIELIHALRNEGVPSEAKVAAIFLAMWPGLPIPVTITLPLHFSISSRILMNTSFKQSLVFSRASISVSNTFLASLNQSM